MSDEEWALVEPLLPHARNGGTGRPRLYSRREMLGDLLYVLRTGCQWRNLSHDLAPWGSVWMQFTSRRNDGTLEHLHLHLRA